MVCIECTLCVRVQPDRVRRIWGCQFIPILQKRSPKTIRSRPEWGLYRLSSGIWCAASLAMPTASPYSWGVGDLEYYVRLCLMVMRWEAHRLKERHVAREKGPMGSLDEGVSDATRRCQRQCIKLEMKA